MARFLSLVAALLFVALPSAVSAQASGAMTLAEFSAAMKRANMSPAFVQRDDGTRMINGSTQLSDLNVKFFVRASACTKSEGPCSNYVLFANFNLPNGVSDAMKAKVNKFNDRNYLGRAYWGEKKVGVDYVVELSGGVFSRYVDARLEKFVTVLENFIGKMRAD